MIKSGAKVTVDETDGVTVISIFPDTQTWQRMALGIWAIGWTLSGLLAFVGALKDMEGDALTFLLVFMVFWFYFLFYALRSLVWHRTGAEYIRLADGNLDYKRSWGSYGRVKSYDLETIKELGTVNYEDKKFAKTYGDAFWTIGGEMIGFTYIGKKVAFGFKLEEGQAKDIVRRIEKARSRVLKAKD